MALTSVNRMMCILNLTEIVNFFEESVLSNLFLMIYLCVDLVSLAHVLQKKYALLRDLDKSLQGNITTQFVSFTCFLKIMLCKVTLIFVENQRQNEQRCEKEIEDIRRGRTANVTPNAHFSEEAIDEQKHSVRIADEKVALAMQAYDLVICFFSNFSHPLSS